MSTPRISVLSIGAGYFARFQIDAWHRMEGVSVVGIADLDLDKAADAATGLNDVETGQDAAAMMQRLQPDIIDIAAPPAAHFDLIQAAINAQPRVVICQKPFCATEEQAARAVDLARSAGVALVVHENFRFQPWYRVMRDELAAGRVGDLYQITFRLRTGDGQGPDAYLSRQPYFQQMERLLVHETAVHWIDTFRFLMGEPDAVFADLRRLNPVIRGEDAGLIVFRYEDGRRAIFDGNRLSDHAADDPRLTLGECIVEGSDGTLSLDGFGQLRFRGFGTKMDEVLPTGYSREGFGGGCVDALQAHILRHLTDGTPLENEASDYLRNQQIERAIYDSAASGGFVGV